MLSSHSVALKLGSMVRPSGFLIPFVVGRDHSGGSANVLLCQSRAVHCVKGGGALTPQVSVWGVHLAPKVPETLSFFMCPVAP